MKVWLRRALSAIALWALCGTAAALPTLRPDYRLGLHQFTADDGLPQAGANALLQTRDGYLWIGTFGGLARFDGLGFKIFRAEPSLASPDTPGRPQAGPASDRILALLEDDRQQLWIGTQDAGLSVYRHGAFHHLPICGGTCQVNGIVQTPDRQLWVLSNVGLFRLDPEHQRVSWIDSERTGHVRLVRDRRGRIYVGGGEGLFVLDEGRLRRVPLPAGDGWVLVLETSGRDLLVGTNRQLYRYDPDRDRWRSLDVASPTAAERDADGRWWVATASGRLLQENGTGQWREIPELFGVGVVSLARDDEGNLWIGSGSKGLWRVRKPVFGLVPALSAGMNMAGRAVIADGHGGLWLGSACGGLRHWRRDGRMLRQPVLRAAADECITSLSSDGDALWVGTAEGLLLRIEQGQAIPVGAWPGGGAINVWQQGERRLLIGSGRSVREVDIDGEGRIARQRRIEALPDMSINTIVPAAAGGHWFAGDRGVWRLVGHRIAERWTPQEGLSSRFARAVYEDQATATLWVGTYGGGLNRIRNGRVQRYDSRNGLFDDTVSCILSDGHGRLWLGGNRGITLLPAPREAAAKIESVGYTATDGLIPAEINGGYSTACHRDAQGRLWFSLVEGFAVVDPEDFPVAPSVPLRARIEEVAVAGRAQKIAAASLTLEPSARSLEIHYTAINLSRPRDTYFRFRLLGFDHDWVEAGQNRSILYPMIPWGEHLFEVQARTQGGRWSPVSARLRIRNPQPWYLQPWALILATASILLVLVAATHLGSGHDRVGPQKDAE